MGQELALAKGNADAVRARVEGPDEQDHEKDPASFGAELGGGSRVGERARDLAEPDEAAQQPNVDGHEGRAHPGREAEFGVLVGEGRDAGRHEDQRHAHVRVWPEGLQGGRVGGHYQGANHGGRRNGSVARAANQTGRFPGRDRDEDRYQRPEEGFAQRHHDEERRHEDERTQGPLAKHAASPSARTGAAGWQTRSARHRTPWARNRARGRP